MKCPTCSADRNDLREHHERTVETMNFVLLTLVSKDRVGVMHREALKRVTDWLAEDKTRREKGHLP